jgi:hypothetical protein
MDSTFGTERAEICGCGRSFITPAALKNHQRSCRATKRQLNKALEKAKEVWSSRKRRRVESLAAPGSNGVAGPAQANTVRVIGLHHFRMDKTDTLLTCRCLL